jgi:hypothetical protein
LGRGRGRNASMHVDTTGVVYGQGEKENREAKEELCDRRMEDVTARDGGRFAMVALEAELARAAEREATMARGPATSMHFRRQLPHHHYHACYILVLQLFSLERYWHSKGTLFSDSRAPCAPFNVENIACLGPVLCAGVT